MTAIWILLGIGAVALFIFIGFYLWTQARENYGFNIFNVGVIIRGLISGFCLALALSIDSDDGSGTVLFVLFVVLWLWTFIVTVIRTNIFIGIFSIVYQAIASVLVFSLINRVVKAVRD